MTALPEDDMSELVDADFPRVDLVSRGANGIPRFLIAKQDAAGLLDAGYVRDLIAKAEPDQPEPGREDHVTMTGSPAAIAKLIHDAAQKREPGDVAKAKISTADKNDLPDSDFAYIEPGGHKDEHGRTTPRSKRHFPVHDASHVRNALARIAGGAQFGDKAIGKVKSAARKFGIKITKKEAADIAKAIGEEILKADAGDLLDAQLDDGVDGLDPTVPLAAPEDDDAPGDPTDPGSPAWEAIDAATAQKWCTILSRARVAVDLLSEREALEAASADPDDAQNACDLQQVCCAIDYAISVLAPFAVGEQSEADTGAEEMAAIGKAAAAAEGPLSVVEPLAAIAKAGRVLSGANEALIRSAGESLSKVLASLPSAPIADEVAKQKETAVAADETKPAGGPQDVAKETAQDMDLESLHGVAKDADAPAEPQAGAAEGVAKADADGEGKAKMVAVFDSHGDLVGVCDPADITPVAGADAPPSNEEAPAEARPEPAPDASSMTPAPAASAGTPAGDVAKADADGDDDPREVLKSLVAEGVAAALDARSPAEDVAKQADVAALLEEVSVLKARLAAVEEQPAAPKVFTSGAVPPPGTLRGQDRAAGGQPVDVAKARERKAELYAAAAPEQARIAKEMQEEAIGVLAAMHAAAR